MTRQASVHPLRNEIRPYAWGSVTALPEFLGVDPTGQPAAELWMGAHPGAPSRLAEGEGTLADLIAANPKDLLGADVAERFGNSLPFLLKVLAVERPLSLQAHPNLAQAAAGFEDEELRGIPLDAAERNYKDPNHKPEQVCALTPFTGMCGFRPVTQSAELLTALEVPRLQGYPERLAGVGGLREVVTGFLTMPEPVITALIDQVVPALERLAGAPGRWHDQAEWMLELAREYPHDRGVMVCLLLNLVHLEPGESMFLGAGVPHVYLRGTAVEILASSDNVLRCGFTAKHVDVPELMRVLRIEETPLPATEPNDVAPGIAQYPSEVPDFILYRLRPGAGPVALPAGAPRILLCTRGTVELSDALDEDGPPTDIGRGGSAFLPADAQIRVSAVSGEPEAYLATVNAV